MTATKTTSPELLDTLRWESGRTDFDQKPFRTIEFAAMELHNMREARNEYFACFDGMQNTREDMQRVQLELNLIPHAVKAARRSALFISQITHTSARLRARGERTAALLDEWIEFLADRYIDAADLIKIAAAAK